jgi:hypothetical protein
MTVACWTERHFRHCERSEAIQSQEGSLDRFASLAMTAIDRELTVADPTRRANHLRDFFFVHPCGGNKQLRRRVRQTANFANIFKR